MIHLDTNYLFLILSGDRSVARELLGWYQKGELVAVSAVAWAEFWVQPIDRARFTQIEKLLQGGVAAFGRREAERAGDLHRALKLRRQDRADTFIAATAILAEASLATRDRRGFARFVAHGLKLA